MKQLFMYSKGNSLQDEWQNEIVSRSCNIICVFLYTQKLWTTWLHVIHCACYVFPNNALKNHFYAEFSNNFK